MKNNKLWIVGIIIIGILLSQYTQLFSFIMGAELGISYINSSSLNTYATGRGGTSAQSNGSDFEFLIAQPTPESSYASLLLQSASANNQDISNFLNTHINTGPGFGTYTRDYEPMNIAAGVYPWLGPWDGGSAGQYMRLSIHPAFSTTFGIGYTQLFNVKIQDDNGNSFNICGLCSIAEKKCFAKDPGIGPICTAQNCLTGKWNYVSGTISLKQGGYTINDCPNGVYNYFYRYFPLTNKCSQIIQHVSDATPNDYPTIEVCQNNIVNVLEVDTQTCGDYYCNDDEDCEICSEDCGECENETTLLSYRGGESGVSGYTGSAKTLTKTSSEKETETSSGGFNIFGLIFIIGMGIGIGYLITRRKNGKF